MAKCANCLVEVAKVNVANWRFLSDFPDRIHHVNKASVRLMLMPAPSASSPHRQQQQQQLQVPLQVHQLHRKRRTKGHLHHLHHLNHETTGQLTAKHGGD